MSINKWGPAVWLLFHTMVEKIKEPDKKSFEEFNWDVVIKKLIKLLKNTNERI